MNVREIMTNNPACCMQDSTIQEAARMMAECDCGAVPVIESTEVKRPIGVVTDRDIAVRIVAKGRNPLEMTVAEAMTEQAITVNANADVEEAAMLMKEHQLRRLVVVDNDEAVIGILAQADLARMGSDLRTGEVVEAISKQAAIA